MRPRVPTTAEPLLGLSLGRRSSGNRLPSAGGQPRSRATQPVMIHAAFRTSRLKYRSHQPIVGGSGPFPTGASSRCFHTLSDALRQGSLCLLRTKTTLKRRGPRRRLRHVPNNWNPITTRGAWLLGSHNRKVPLTRSPSSQPRRQPRHPRTSSHDVAPTERSIHPAAYPKANSGEMAA
jgi:hypothetical protein